MPEALAERDWKYIRSIHDELLCALCERINRECTSILTSREGTAYKRYLRVVKHVQTSDRIVADCFNDLRRSTLKLKICNMNRAGILTPQHLQQLSPEAQDMIKMVEGMLRK